MAYNTGNPIGSGDPRDLRDNAENLDEALNGEATTWVDRLGNTRTSFRAAEAAADAAEAAADRAIADINALDDEAQQALDDAEVSWESRFVAGQDDRADRFETAQDSREAQFVQLMISGGYTGTGADGAIEEYASGITVSAYKEIIRENGEFWRPAADTALPHTTTGEGMPEGGAFVSVGDGVLRQDLVQPVATFNSVADMKNSANLDVGRKARALGYYEPGDGGGNDYEIVAAGTGTDDGGSFIDLSGSGLQAKGLFQDVVNIKQFGAKGDDASDNTSAINACLAYSNNVYIPNGIYRISSTIQKIGSNFKIYGDGAFASRIKAAPGTYDILRLSNNNNPLSRIFLSGFIVEALDNDKTSGASIYFDGNLVNSHIDNIYVRNFYDAFVLTGVTKSYFSNIWYDQFGRVSGKGANGFNCQNTYNRQVDWHLTNIQGSGFKDTMTSQLQNHFFITGCDGIYMQNSHFFYSDRVMNFSPTNIGFGDTISSVLVSNCYFDTTETNHVFFTNTASKAYQSIHFVNTLFRGARAGDCISTGGDLGNHIDHLTFSGCIFRGNKKSGIKFTDADFNAKNMNVSGCTFTGNNTENQTLAGDIVTRGSNGVITGCTFIGGGSSGHALRLLSGANFNAIANLSMEESTATDRLVNGGAGNKFSNTTGALVENSGLAIVAIGSSAVVVEHGLAQQPSITQISITPTSDASFRGVASWWINNVTATSFTINVDSDVVTAGLTFAWQAKYK